MWWPAIKRKGGWALAFALAVALSWTPARGAEDADSLQKAIQLVRMADLWLKDGNLKAAERYYHRALKLNGELEAAWRGLGRIEARRRKWGRAAKWFRKIEHKHPDDLEAHYYLGIQRRESGKFKGLLLRQLDFRAAEKHFRKVIQRDSLYSDIWYQLALLERYREHYLKAIQLTHKQIHLKPSLLIPRVKIFRFYDLFVEHEDSARVFRELSSERYGWLGRFFRAEKLRRLGHLDSARLAFERLLVPDNEGSRTAVYLRLTRIAIQQGHDELAQKLYWEAIRSIRTQVDAELAFNDVKYILTDNEFARWQRCVLLGQKKRFFYQIWAGRDPFPGSQDNPRLVEHYRRLIFAEKWYRQDEPHRPFHALDLGWDTKPRVFALNEEFHQKGLVYIRWGEPDDKSVYTDQNHATYESWMYNRTVKQPQVIVHFANPEDATPSDWRISRIPPPAVVWNMGLETWDVRYHRYVTAGSEVEQRAAALEIELDLQESGRLLVTQERMVFPDSIRLLPAHFYWATYKGHKRGTLDLNFYYGLAFKDAFEKKDPVGLKRYFETGIGIFDTVWTPVVHRLHRFALSRPRKLGSGVATDAQTIPLRPGIYRLTFFVRDDAHKRVGSWRFLDTLHTYEDGQFDVSDLTVAVDIAPDLPLQAGRFRRHGLVVAPNPTRIFTRQQPIYVYFEVYGLTLDENGVAHCRVTYTLDPRRKKRTGFLGLFGRRLGAVSVTNEFEPSSSDIPVYTALDASRFGTGEIELRVNVTDLNAGKSASRSITIRLVKG